jgi:branched-chain amino acid aminotransferase
LFEVKELLDNTNFPQASKYWYMGKFHDWTAVLLHPMTHALHYGSAVFEGIRAYETDKGPAVFRLDEHMDRLFHSAAVLNIKIPFDRMIIIEAIKENIKVNKQSNAYIRPLIFCSYGTSSLDSTQCPIEMLIASWEKGAHFKSESGVSAFVLPVYRIHLSQIDMSAKLGGIYVQSVICSFEAKKNNCEEGIFLNLEGNIAEGAGENIFICQNGVVKTNDRSESILEGITRTSLLELAADLGYKTIVGPITKEELIHADEAFFTGTAVEVTPIVRIVDGTVQDTQDNKHVISKGKPGAITTHLANTYKDMVRGRIDKYNKWLTYVYE